MTQSESECAADLARVEAMRALLDACKTIDAQDRRGIDIELKELYGDLFRKVERIIENGKELQG